MNDIIQTVAVYALPVLFAITLHEAAHAFAAKFFGDTTAYSQGRMSLNPAKHIDPFGTIILPALIYIGSGGNFLFGSAKPVPVVWGNLRKPKRDMAWVALAGPGANFLMAFLWVVFGMTLSAVGIDEEFFQQMAVAGLRTNLIFMAFNLLPIPPLDGSRVVFSLLPQKMAWQYARLEPYGMFIVLGLIAASVMLHLPLLSMWMAPVIGIANYLLKLLLTPFIFLLT